MEPPDFASYYADPQRPLEWWEQAQVALLEAWTRRTAPAFLDMVKRFREYPAEWRAFRDRLKKETGR